MKSWLLLLLLFPLMGTAQLRYQDFSYQQALQKAAAEGKLVFIQFESESCQQCNEVADKGLSDVKLAALLERDFIAIKSRPTDRDRQEIAGLFHMGNGFGSLFVNQSGTLLHKYPMTTSFSQQYFTQVDIALEKAGESQKLNELEKEYRAGNNSFGFLEQLLLKKKELNLDTDTLLAEYIAALPPDSVLSTKTLQFIATMAPVLGSPSDRFLRRNPAAFQQSWYLMPLQTRVQINNEIIYKSLNKAIKEKNERYANQVAGFSQAVHERNSLAGHKAYHTHMLRYYEQTKDTGKYLDLANRFIERHYMTLNPDSIKRIDSVSMKALQKTAKKDTARDGSSMRVTSTVAFRPAAQSYMAVLNDAAWNIYKTTSNPWRLSTALRWAGRALEFYKSPEALDTYAKLSYKLGDKKNAIQAMEEAIALKKKYGYPSAAYEADLQKMKDNRNVE